jgi:hypothetical protein
MRFYWGDWHDIIILYYGQYKVLVVDLELYDVRMLIITLFVSKKNKFRKTIES